MPTTLDRQIKAVIGVEKEEFGLRLRELRMRMGLSQKGLADATPGISQSQISQWESGKNSPAATFIPALAEALGVDPGELFKPAAGEPEAPKRGRPPKEEPPAKPKRKPPKKG